MYVKLILLRVNGILYYFANRLLKRVPILHNNMQCLSELKKNYYIYFDT